MLQKNRLRYGILALILIALAGIFAVRVSESFTEAEQDTQPLAVTTGLAVLGTVDSDAYLNGTVEGETSSLISSPMAGRIVRVAVEDGQSVSRGQVLAQLDTVELENAVRAAEFSLRQAEARQGNVAVNFDRVHQLFAQGVVSRQQMETAQTETVTANLETEIARTNLTTARKHLAEAVIVSPSDGVAANRTMTAGQFIAAGANLLTVEEIARVYVTLQIPQKDMADVAIGNTAAIRVDTYPDRTFTGSVAVINPAANAENRMFRVKLLVENGELLLKPGMFVQARLAGGAPTKALLVPKTAVLEQKGVRYVFVAEDGRAVRTHVETGEPVGDMMEIRDGIAEGTRIVLDQLDRVQDGSPIVWKEAGA